MEETNKDLENNRKEENRKEENLEKTPGEILEQTRKSKGLTIRDISEQLHLLPLYVESLENGNYKKIPSTAFVKGYMRSYATFLGLDANDLIARLPSEYQLERVFSKNTDSANNGSAKLQKISFILISLIFILGLLGLTLYWWQLRGEDDKKPNGAYDAKVEQIQEKTQVLEPTQEPVLEQETLETQTNQAEQNLDTENTEDQTVASSDQQNSEGQTQAVQEEQQTQEAPAVAKTQIEAEPAPKPKPSFKTLAKLANPGNLDLNALSGLNGGTFVLTFVGECWLQAKDADGNELISTTAKAGDLIKIEGKKPIKLILGKGANARANYKNAEFDLKPFTGESVARLTIR